MQKKLLAVAVAGALVSGSAFAQTSVTISGALNLWWESVRAEGATAGSASDVKSRDRISDGAGSNVRFTVVEDIGGGMQAFGQVESAVFSNADTRNNAFGAGAATSGWGNRNSGVGLRSKAWGEILLGVWDVHYNEHYAADGGLLKGTSSSNSLGLLNTFGTGTPAIGGRYSNVIRYASPNWSGFSFRAVYARPTDASTTTPALAGTIGYNKKNRVVNFAPSYSAGPIFVGYTHLTDKDVASTANATLGIAAGNSKIRSDRLSAAYTFPMGIKIGFIYDRSKWSIDTAGGSGDLKRDVWVLPLSYTAGPHGLHFQYSRAKDWKGSAVDGTTVVVGTNTYSATGDSAAKMWSLVYQYDLSKRTNVHLAYSNIKNDSLAAYDFFAAGVGGVAAGADPRQYSIGLRHAF